MQHLKVFVILVLCFVVVSSCGKRDLTEHKECRDDLTTTDLFKLAAELRALSSHGVVSLNSLLTYMDRDDETHWKLTDGVGSLDHVNFIFSSKTIQNLEIHATYTKPDINSSGLAENDGPLLKLEIVVLGGAKLSDKIIFNVIERGEICYGHE